MLQEAQDQVGVLSLVFFWQGQANQRFVSQCPGEICHTMFRYLPALQPLDPVASDVRSSLFVIASFFTHTPLFKPTHDVYL
jgi:hypothetical protein